MARRTEDRDFLTIYDWMISPDGLGLKVTSASCTVYARIYAASHHGQGATFETQGHLAQLLGMSREAVCRAVRLLKERGLVEERATVGPERTGLKLLAVVQEPIDRAIESCDATFDEEAAEAFRASTEGVEEPTAFREPPCDRKSHPCDRKSQGGELTTPPCDRESHLVIENHKVMTCEMFKTSEFSTNQSTSGNAEKTELDSKKQLTALSSKEDLEDRKKKNNNNKYIYKYDCSSLVDNHLSFQEDNPQVDTVRVPASQRRAFETFIESSPKHVGEEHVEATAGAWIRAVEAGYEPSVILEAWHRYLDWFLNPSRPEPTRALRYLMWPKSFLERDAGLSRWANASGDTRQVAPTPDGGRVGRLAVGRNGSERWWIHIGPDGISQVCPVSVASDEAGAWAVMEGRNSSRTENPENGPVADPATECGESNDVRYSMSEDKDEVAVETVSSCAKKKSRVARHRSPDLIYAGHTCESELQARDPPSSRASLERRWL